MKKTVIALDPGLSTGLAVLSKENLLLMHVLTIRVQDLSRTLKFFDEAYPDADVVVEDFPPSISRDLKANLQQVRQIITSTFSSIVWVQPGTWKNTRAKLYKATEASTPHEKDAIRIGFWFIKLFERKG